ncbi:MAG: penicillin-binding protein 2 [Candidatus Gygaella obscura]|nr:penicillin-binding protein 2 [Candidatus Gygaella obscura]
MRTRSVYLIFLGIFSFIVLGLFYAQVIRGNHYSRLSYHNYIRIFPEEGIRGRILDKDNRLIAENQVSFDCYVNLRQTGDEVISFLSRHLDLSKQEIKRKIKRNLKSQDLPVLIYKGLSKEKAFLIKENSLSYPAVLVKFNHSRFYPYAEATSHISGYLGQISKSLITKLKDYGYSTQDFIGYGGVEQAMDKFLRSESGGSQIQVDSRGRQIALLGFKAANDGLDVRLTVDVRMQTIAYNVLKKYKGAIVILEPDTGKVLAMVSSPAFDANVFIQGKDSHKISEILTDKNSCLLNRAISASYPPASIFKLVVASSGLDNNKISLEDTFNCNGALRIGNRSFSCSGVHGVQNLEDAIANSCNVFFYNLGLRIGARAIIEAAHRFRLGKKTGIDLPYEVSGFLPSLLSNKLLLKKWYSGDTANISIGQGELLVTPLQAARLISIFANYGKLVKPYIIESIAGVDNFLPQVTKLDFEKNVIATVRSALRRTVTDTNGTAKIMNMNRLSVAGKTGTAQVGNKRSHGWFVGFAPYDEPKIAFCVFLENAGSSYRSCQVARKMLELFIKENLL